MWQKTKRRNKDKVYECYSTVLVYYILITHPILYQNYVLVDVFSIIFSRKSVRYKFIKIKCVEYICNEAKVFKRLEKQCVVSNNPIAHIMYWVDRWFCTQFFENCFERLMNLSLPSIFCQLSADIFSLLLKFIWTSQRSIFVML